MKNVKHLDNGRLGYVGSKVCSEKAYECTLPLIYPTKNLSTAANNNKYFDPTRNVERGLCLSAEYYPAISCRKGK